MANPNIALSFRAPQFRSPLETYGRAQQIAVNAMAMQKAARDTETANAARNYIAGGGKLETSADIDRAMKAGVPMDVIGQYADVAGKAAAATAKSRESTEERLLSRLPRIAQTGDDVAWQRWLSDWSAIDKTDADEMLRITGGKADRDVILSIMAGADAYFQKNVPAATSTVQYDPSGAAFEARVGGLGQRGMFPLQEYGLDTGGAAPAPSTPVGPRAAPAAGAVTPDTLRDRGIPENEIPMGNPLEPIAYAPGEAASQMPALTVETAPQIIQQAVQTGAIDQTHLEQLRQIVGPENDQGLADWMRQNNVRIQPTGAPQFQSAVYRPDIAPAEAQFLGGGETPIAQAQPTEFVPTGRQFVGKSPMQSPLPGSAAVPIQRVRDEARAGRESPDEVYAKEKARIRAQQEAGPKPLTAPQEAQLRKNITKDFKSTQSTVDMMLNPKFGVVAAVNAVRKLSPDQKEAVTGWSGYAPSITPGSRSADVAIKNLKGKVTEMGKNAASLTGSVGQMAVQEWRIVSDMIANLDPTGMEPADLDNQLDIIEAQARRAAEITQDAYNNQYMEDFARYPGRFQLKSPEDAEVAESQVPPAAVAYLRKNPSLRADFDKKYGKGAAAKALGGR